LREGLYAIRDSSEIFVRRIVIDPMKNRLTVLTDHPAYPSWPGIQRKGIDIVGQVIWIGARVP
jgi:phage repressor protein C with HTH and peptisase S24 domain